MNRTSVVSPEQDQEPEQLAGSDAAPTADAAPAGAPSHATGSQTTTSPAARRGLVRRFLANIRSYGELRHTPYGIGPALILASIGFFQAFDTQAFSVAAPEIVRDLEVEITDIIDVRRFVAFFAILAAIGAGWYADRHRRTPFVGIGTMISGFFSMLTSRAGSTLSVGLPRVVDDVSNTAANVPAFSLAADYYPGESRGRMFAMIASFDRIGLLVATFVVGIAVEVLGWRTSLVIFGAPLVLMGFFALLGLREPIRGYFERKAFGADEEVARTEDEPLSFGEAWRTTFSVRTLRRLFIADIVTGSGIALFALFTPFYLADEYQLGAFERSMFGLPSLVAALVAGLIGGAMIDRVIGRNPGRVLTIIGLYRLVGAFAILGLAFKPPLPVLVAMFALFSFGAAFTGPASGVVYAQVIPPSIRTQGLMITGLSELPGILFFVGIGETVFRNSGYQGVFLYAFPFLIIGALIAATAGAFFDVDRRNAFSASLAADEARRTKAAGEGKLLVCRDVDVEYDGVQVLFGVDLDVRQGEILALLGTNGAGKSTLLRAISGVQQASAGAIVYDGRDITHMPPHEVASRGIIHMPGGRGIFPGLTVRDNLLLGVMGTEDRQVAHARLEEVLEIFPVLRSRPEVSAGALSGGEQQQLSLAMAFLQQPRLLMIDELSLGLSPVVVAQLLEIIREINRRGVTVVVVEQSVNVALQLADRAAFMEKGAVKFFGPTRDLLARPDILRAVYVKGTSGLTGSAPRGAARSEREQRALELDTARPVLSVSDLTKRFGGITAVDHVSFELREGEVLGLIGPNGAGKTTIFDLVSGHQRPDGGVIEYGGIDVTHVRPEERARRGLVRRFQDAKLFPGLTVFETILVALEQKLEVRNTIINAAQLPQARRAERRVRVRAERLVELFELGTYRDKFVKELSTGMRRIVDLACVLAADPKVLLLDEPSSGIAQAEAEGLAPLLRRVRFETGCSILIIEHDMPLISSVADELVALTEGAVICRGTPDDVLNDERVIESYLGSSESSIRRSGEID